MTIKRKKDILQNILYLLNCSLKTKLLHLQLTDVQLRTVFNENWIEKNNLIIFVWDQEYHYFGFDHSFFIEFDHDHDDDEQNDY